MSTVRRLRVSAGGLAICVVIGLAGAAWGAGDRPAPGLYTVTSTIAGEKPRTRQECMTRERLAEVFALPATSGKCSVTRSVATGGRIDLAQSCTAGTRVTSGSVAGTYTAAGYDLRIIARAPELPRPLDVRMSARRTGDCSED